MSNVFYFDKARASPCALNNYDVNLKQEGYN